jgi:hypothetical protein
VAALKRSARPLPGYGPLDYGAGLVDVPAAWEAYRSLAQGDPSDPVLFEVEAESPDQRGGKGPSVYWRGSFPAGEVQEFTVAPIWPEGTSAEFKAHYYKAFDFSCKADWLRLQTGSHYIKAGAPARVRFSFDAAKLGRPGLYESSIEGWAKGAPRAAGAGPDVTIPVAVMVPHDLGACKAFETDVKDLMPAKLKRYFLRVPATLGALSISLSIPDAQKGSLSAALFDPQGREVWTSTLKPASRKSSKVLSRAGIEAGTWELTLYGAYANLGPVDAKVKVRPVPMAAPVPESATVKLRMGKAPEAEIRVATSLDFPLKGRADASIVGCTQQGMEAVSGDMYTRDFSILPGESGVTFDLEMSAEDFNLFTDIAVQVIDKESAALAQEGLTFRKGSLSFTPSRDTDSKAKYSLRISAAAADPDGKPHWSVKVTETHRYDDPVKVRVTQGKSSEIALYPDRETGLSLRVDSAPPALPSGASWLLQGEVRDERDQDLVLPLEVRLAPGGDKGRD